jgi:hypothetical protein
MPLSYEAVLVYVLHSGCVGRLTFGRVERNEASGLDVYSPDPNMMNDYISGTRLRSWCVMGRNRKPVRDWYSIRPEDEQRVFSAASWLL